MAAPTPPSWLFPSILPISRTGDRVPPTWHVVFICPMEDAERVEMMTKLSTIDENWLDRPQAAMQRLVEIPWLMDWTPPTSAIFSIVKDDPLIVVDDQSQIDQTAIIIWKASTESSPEAARVPIARANILLGVAAQGGLSSEYARILPEPKAQPAIPTINRVLPSHLAGLRLEPSIPTLVSLVHLPEAAQRNLESMIGCQTIIRNWPKAQDPCSHTQLYRMFQALKISHESNYQAFALFIDEVPEDSEESDRPGGYRIVNAKGSSFPHFSDEDGSKLEITTLPFDKVEEYWNAAWNPESRIPATVPKGPYKYNAAMWKLNKFGGDPIVNPDDIANSLDTSVIFVLEKMTETELRKIRWEIFRGCDSDENFMWVDVSDRLVSPDMQGLVTYFESGEFTNHSPPYHFLAVDRQTLADAMEPFDERDALEAIIVASYEAGDVWFSDDMNRSFGYISTGYGYYRGDYDEVQNIHINLVISNMSWDEMCQHSPVVYWSAYRKWAEENLGQSFSRSFGPGGMRTSME